MLEKVIVKKNENVLKEIGKDTIIAFYEIGKFIGGNFAIPTYLRSIPNYNSNYDGGNSVGAVQIIPGFAGYFVNGINIGLVALGENNYPDYFAIPSSVWFATNIASAGYEWYRNVRDRISEERRIFSNEELDNLSVDELAQKILEGGE